MSDRPDLEATPDGSARRRNLTIVFCDLSDSARLAGTMEAEDYADLLAKFRRICEDAMSKHGGAIVQILGDGVLATFGYPDAREDDGRRATEAALDLHDMVRRVRIDLPSTAAHRLGLHTGIHSGLVLLDKGDAVSGRMRLFGNAINIAARLSDAAEKDQILVSAETLGAESHFFQIGAQQILELPGIAGSVAVHSITGRAAVCNRFEARSKRGLTPFVGRRLELESLTSGAKDAVAGKPRFMAIAAPAGSGKTRLAEEFLGRAASLSCHVHRGYCESYLSAEPLQPFLQMLRSLVGLNYGMSAARAAEALDQTLLAIDPALASHRSVLLRVLSLNVPAATGAETSKAAPENTLAAIAALFEAIAVTKPLLLFIDDWQWADDATRQVIGQIRSLTRCAIFVLVATREAAPGDVGMSDAQILNLNPLTADEAEQAIGQLLPGYDTFTMSEIRDYSGGNPLFVEELCHSAAHRHWDRLAGRAQGGKAWLNTLIQSRIELLSTRQIELIRAAAIIGNVIPARLLESITGCREDDPLVLALAEQDLIYPGEQPGTLRFKHGIARDVIYESIGLHQRRSMHMQIAEALRQQVSAGLEEEFYEPLAYHYAAAGQAREAAHYAELAGDKAVGAAALDRAQVQYLAALAAIDLLEPSQHTYERWMVIAQRLALAGVFDPSWDRLKVLQRAAGLAAAHDDAHAVARAEYWVGYMYFALGEPARAIRCLEIARERALQVDDVQLIAAIRALLGQAFVAASDYDKAVALLEEATVLRHPLKKRSRPAMAFAYVLAVKGALLGDRGRFDDAYQCFDEALAGVRGSGHEVECSILTWHSAVSLWQGRWGDARRSALEAQRIAERVKSLYLYAMSLSLGAFASWMTQGAPGSLQTIADATSWLEGRQMHLFVSLNHGWLAEGMAAGERWEEARRRAARALTHARTRDRIGAAMACRAMARASAAGRNHQPAEYYIALAMRNAAARGSPHEVAVTRLCEAEIRSARGERIEAAALLDQAEAAFAALAMTWHANAARKLRKDL